MGHNYDDILCLLSDDCVDDYIKMIAKIPLLSKEEEKELGYRILDGDKEAINEMIIHNLRYVVSIAKQFTVFGLPLADVIQDGNIGLIKAANGFDASLGYKFLTYARDHIIQCIELGIANNSRNVRIPYHRFEKLIKYKKAVLKLTDNLHRAPTKEEIAAEIKDNVTNVKLYEQFIDDTLSVNYYLSDDCEFGDMLSADRMVEDSVISDELPSLLEAVFEKVGLDDVSIDILRKKYGLGDVEECEYKDIALEYGKSEAWVRGKKAYALKKIRSSKHFKNTFME